MAPCRPLWGRLEAVVPAASGYEAADNIFEPSHPEGRAIAIEVRRTIERDSERHGRRDASLSSQTRKIHLVMDLSQYTLLQLQQLRTRIAKEVDKRQASTKSDLLKRLTKMAREHGLSLTDVVSNAAPTAQKAKRVTAKGPIAPKEPLPAKYRHPNNRDLAWSGRGRRPQWVDAWLAQGGSLDGLEIAAQKMGKRKTRAAAPAAEAKAAKFEHQAEAPAAAAE